MWLCALLGGSRSQRGCSGSARRRPLCRRLTLEALEDRATPSAVTVFATGLDNPRGLEFGPNGHLYVAEAGLGGTASTVGTHEQVPPPLGPLTGGYTGRISRINPAGQRHTLVDGLPSAQSTPQTGSEVLGASAVNFIGRDMYVLIQAGASKGLEGTFNGVFRVRPNGSLVTVANLSAHNQAVFDGIPDDDHDPEGNPYSMAASGGTLYVTEANHGAVNRVNLDGTVTRLVDVAAQVGHITPTAITVGPDGNIYMGVIGEFPYLDGTAKVFQITPAGAMSVFADNMTAVVDLDFDPQGRLYALETFTGNVPAPPFFNPSSGRIRRLTGSGWQTVVSGLTNPTAMTFGPDNHLYVSNKGHGFGTTAGQGQILEIDVGLRSRHGHGSGGETDASKVVAQVLPQELSAVSGRIQQSVNSFQVAAPPERAGRSDLPTVTVHDDDSSGALIVGLNGMDRMAGSEVAHDDLFALWGLEEEWDGWMPASTKPQSRHK